MEQLTRHKDKRVTLLLYNKRSTVQLEIYNITIRHKDKYKLCNFLVVCGNEPVLLGMPDIKNWASLV